MHSGNETAADEVRDVYQCARGAWKLIPPQHKWALGGASAVMACVSACNTALPLCLGQLVDVIHRGVESRLSPSDIYISAAWFLGYMAALYVLRESLNVLRAALVTRTCTRINRDMNLRLIDHILTLPLNRLGREKVGALHGRIVRSVDGLVRFVRLNFLDFLPALLTSLFALGLTLSSQPRLALAMAGVVPISLFVTIRQLSTQHGVRLQLMRSCEEIDGVIVEQLEGIEYVRAADTRRQEILRLSEASERRRAMEVQHHFEMSLFGCAKALNEAAFHILVLAGAVYLATRGEISYGDVLAYSMLFLNVMQPLADIHRVMDEGHESSLQVNDLLQMLGQPVDASFVSEPAPLAPPQPTRNVCHELVVGSPVITADGLRVAYDEHSTGSSGRRFALDGVSLEILHGQTIGIAGRSGCGKSTFLRVLLRLIHPTAGDLHICRSPIRSLSRADIGQMFGYVGQSPFVFAGTIAQNIAYGSPSPSQEDLERVARLVQMHDEILAMPGGYQAAVTERGQNLSGGQRQRLALARILLRRPPILVLDEATSALDNISERHVQRALGMSHGDRTTILVAHRLSTLRDADRILVFEDGRIVESGDYDELVAAEGVFAKLAQSADEGVLAVT